MEPPWRPFDLWDSPANHRTKLLRTCELVKQKDRSADLKRSMRIRPNRACDIMFLSKHLGTFVKTRIHTAGVIDFNGVYIRQNLKQVIFLPATLTHFVKGMRNADKRRLFLQPPDRLLRIKTGGDLKAALALIPITKPIYDQYRDYVEREKPHLKV